MDLELRDSSTANPSPRRLPDRRLMIVAAVGRTCADRSVASLNMAGFAPDRIDVIVVEDVPRLEDPLGGTGLHRFLVHLRLVRGDYLDELEPARRALMNGHALVQVLVDGDEERRCAQAILGRTPGQDMRYLGVIDSPGRGRAPDPLPAVASTV